MKSMILTTAAVLLLWTGNALAGEGNGPGHEFHAAGASRTTIFARDVGAQSAPMPGAGPSVGFAGGALLPQNGSAGAVQTANSLPVGALDGTVIDLQARSVAAFLARRDDAAARLAAMARPLHAG